MATPPAHVVEDPSEGAESHVRYLSDEAVSRSSGVRISSETRDGAMQKRLVKLRDGRRLPNDLEQLFDKGFTFLPFRSAWADRLERIAPRGPPGTPENPAESPESVELRGAYFREVELLVQRLTGADVVMAFHHAVRNGSTSKASVGLDYFTGYSPYVHCDMTIDHLRRGVPKEQAKRMTHVFYNVWQPTTHPVEMSPLAVLDWTSVAEGDVRKVVFDMELKSEDAGKGKSSNNIELMAYNEGHRWFFYPGMRPDEALVFTQVDGRPGFAQHCFHTSADHQTKEDPIQRQSIEVRVLVGFLPGNPALTRKGPRL